MQDFAIGQRWISAAELQLGLGMVIEIEHRTVSIIFPATAEVRIYARENAPITRVRFAEGDWVQNQDDHLMQVTSLQENSGLIVYHCEDEAGHAVVLPEGKLNNYLQLNRPVFQRTAAYGHFGTVSGLRACRLSNQFNRASNLYRLRGFETVFAQSSTGR